MAVNATRVFYVKRFFHPVFAEILARRPTITLDKLENYTPDAEAAPVLAAAHVFSISSARDELDPKYHAGTALFRKTPELLVVSTTGAGYDTVNVKACTAAGILAVNQSGGNREAVAEHVVSVMIALSKRIGETDRVMRREANMDRNLYHGRGCPRQDHRHHRHRQCREPDRRALPRPLRHARAGLRSLSRPRTDRRARRRKGRQLDELLRRADFVSVNCPLTDETRGMIGAREYALMLPHAYFITSARGHIHDETALAAALAQKQIAGAGLDVWSKEPPPLDHPLLKFDNVIVSPHIAGATKQARRNLALIAAEQILDILDGKRPPRMLNPEVWPAYARRFEHCFGFAPQS